jgi:hypothetical protein
LAALLVLLQGIEDRAQPVARAGAALETRRDDRGQCGDRRLGLRRVETVLTADC